MKKIMTLYCLILTITLSWAQELKPFPNKKGKYGYMKDNKKVIPAKYDHASEFKDGVAWVQIGEKWGVIDETGKEIIPIQYDECGFYNKKSQYIWVKLNKKWGAVDKTGKQVVPFQFDHVYQRGNQTFRAKKDGKWGFVDGFGKEITPFKYDEIRDQVDDNVCFVVLDRKWGLFDGEKEITPIKYETILVVNLNPLRFEGRLNGVNIPLSKTGVEGGQSNHYTLENDLPYDVYLYICSSFSTKVTKGSSNGYRCDTPGEVILVEGGGKGRVLFKVNKDICGKVIKLSQYMR